MSDQPTVSRNRADYPAKVHHLLRAAAPVLYDGDLDKAWEGFFDQMEQDAVRFGAQATKAPPDARIQLRFTPAAPAEATPAADNPAPAAEA